jgi:RNA polymerase sigma-70 factor, ECF subfamily
MRSKSALSLVTTEQSIAAVEDAVTEAYRSQWGRLLSVLVVRTRRLDLAEDALAEAFTRAATRWPSDGVPENPSAWLYITAKRLLLGRLRSEAVAGRLAPLLAVRAAKWSPSSFSDTDGTDTDEVLPDERLQLILLCCHPALEPEARSALALRLVLGTSTAEIARLFLVQTSTMAARLTRAKRKIVAAGIPLSLPIGDELVDRIDAVTRTIYLAFTAGYQPGNGTELLRVEEAGEAVRLAATLHQLLPNVSQVQSLVALLMFQHARRDARVCKGELITLDDQDRTLWHRGEIAAAVRILDEIRPSTGYAEELRLQALAAREHAIAASSTDTNWTAIAAHYAELEHLTGSPIVRLNRAVAIAETLGPEAGLEVLEGLEESLDLHHRFHAVRATLARRAGHHATAREAFTRAVALCTNDTERSFLQHQLCELELALDCLVTDPECAASVADTDAIVTGRHKHPGT